MLMQLFDVNVGLVAVALFVGMFPLGYAGPPFWVWPAYYAFAAWGLGAPAFVWAVLLAIAFVLALPPIRQWLVTMPVMKAIAHLNLLPKISDTERAAIEAGTVWVEGELFSGKPDFKRILAEPYPEVEPEVQDFLDGPVEEVCQMATDWEIHQRKDLPPEVWDKLKGDRFLGMMIPKAYGGRGFSNGAYSAVMLKLASRSFVHTATVGVTNSLGPAKLLLHYGTAEQKQHYLPLLARGEEIPCFALTEPKAGSDAASISASGTVFQRHDGELYLRLNWKKRYITLGAIATLIGLAFQLKDPDNLLGKGQEPGITCALIPANTPGVQLGRRHDPMGVPFYNSPIEGHDVVLPVGQIIGGVEQAGKGWTLLMQSLAAGRGISFPATCTGVAKFVSRVTGNYAAVRHQFGLPIGKFEGIEEPLARIGGLTYALEAARNYTVAAVDRGEQPAVVSAIAKYEFTELTRQIVIDGMDIVGGAGICKGPRNLLANLYTAMPIPITVEGSNILTRSLIIFGQGAIRCHPYVYDEIQALEQGDVKAFDKLLWNHLAHLAHNKVRALVLGLTGGRLAAAPVAGPTAVYYRKLAWASAMFAFLTDVAMLFLGGKLKRRETLTGRFADALSWMYLGTATLRRYEAEGRRESDLPLVHWSLQYALAQVQVAVDGILQNLEIPLWGWAMRGPVRWLWQMRPVGEMPGDRLTHEIAQLMQSPGEAREHLTHGIYIPVEEGESLHRLEKAFRLTMAAMPIMQRLKQASREGVLPKQSHTEDWVEAGLRAGLITGGESDLAYAAAIARNDAIQVDSFTLEEYMGGKSSDLKHRDYVL